VGDDLSSSVGVHSRKTKVGTNIGVVDIDDAGASEVSDVFVVNLGVSCGGDGGGTESGSGSEEAATIGLGVEGGLGRRLGVGGERGGRTAVSK